MEMHQIRYFLTLCQELNFTRAAEKCHVAQPALTRAIKLLEEEFGGLLFHRERARTHLSELGQAVRPYLEEVQRQSQHAKRLATSFIELEATPLKLGIMCTIGPGNFVALLSNLQAQHPGIELQIMDAGAAHLQARLLEGELEAAIYCWPDQTDERLHHLPLFREQFFIVLSQQHRLAANNAVRVSDLNGERYLNRINCEQANLARDIFARHGTKVERVYRSERDDWILAMVAAGLGFGFMPQYSISERPDIVVRPLVEPEFWREVSLVTVRGRPHSPAIGALVREAMRTQWLGTDALAVQKSRARNAGKVH
jgi:LysR family transcriptional regulator, hydrogen peroxide-inducible genes activator